MKIGRKIGMRKLVLILLFCMEAFLVFQIMYRAEDTSFFYKFVNAELTASSKRVVLEINSDNAKKAYDALTSLADQLNANVIVSRLTTEDGITKCTKYVYITRPEYYNGFDFYESEPEYPTYDSGWFLSTEKTDDPNQIGRIISFTQNTTGEIHTLYEWLYGEAPFEGVYTIQVEGANKFAAFSDAFSERMGIDMVEADNLATVPVVSGIVLFAVMGVAALCFLPLISLIFFYDMIADAKNIALESMLGHWERSIWVKRVFILLRNQALAFAGMFLLMFVARLRILNPLTMVFLAKLLVVGVLILTLTWGSVVITFYGIGKINIINALKKRLPFRSLHVLNGTAKVALLILVILLCQYAAYISSVATYQARDFDINGNTNTTDDTPGTTYHTPWNKTHDLYIVPAIDPEYLTPAYKTAREALYFPMNERGSILADFAQFLPDTTQSSRPYATATVNPNYLNAFPLRGSDGRVVRVEEDTTEKILLVPEVYRGEEAQIRTYFTVQDQNLVLIWLQNDQPCFTFILSTKPKADSTVSNVILNVLTENNGQPGDYDIVLNKSNPVKIKTRSVNPEAEIRNLLKEQKIDDNVGLIISVYNRVVEEVKRSSELLTLSLFVLIMLTLTLIMVVVQSVDNCMDRHKRLIGIQTFLGRSLWSKYRFYFLSHMTATWSVVLVLSLVLTRLVAFSDWYSVLLFALIFWVTEIITTLITILTLQKRKVLETLKGGG
ncbi:MAG: hypothetical protein LBB49_06065 [Gracilibacteraceae bacterium]|nr:hypothetical protein [Gracilibacteraceae bacterium]